MGTQLKGRPIQIVKVTDQGHKLDEAALCEILLDPRVKKRKVVNVSVAGAFRNGKSSILNFFLRYLSAPNDPNWLGGVNSPLEGFSWKGGTERDTTGILMWSEPFIIKQGQEEVAVLLMDTQGAFDIQSTVKDCATIFALSTLLSSVQVYNISGEIKEVDLQHLQSCIAYGRLALVSNNAFKPFQVLQMLVRDWRFPSTNGYAFGDEGGRKYIERTLQVFDEQNEELKQLREDIRSCFQRIHCYLMPHPGPDVTENPHFDGRLMGMRPVFQEHLKIFIELLLDPSRLVVKETNGSIVTGKRLLKLFKAYMKIFQGDKLPEPKPVFLATAEANNLAAVDEARDLYSKAMESICAPDKPYLKPEDFDRAHTRCVENSLDLFNRTPKMGGAEFSKKYYKELKLKLQDLYKNYVKLNESKTLLTRREALGIGCVAALAGVAVVGGITVAVVGGAVVATVAAAGGGAAASVPAVYAAAASAAKALALGLATAAPAAPAAIAGTAGLALKFTVAAVQHLHHLH